LGLLVSLIVLLVVLLLLEIVIVVICRWGTVITSSKIIFLELILLVRLRLILLLLLAHGLRCLLARRVLEFAHASSLTSDSFQTFKRHSGQSFPYNLRLILTRRTIIVLVLRLRLLVSFLLLAALTSASIHGGGSHSWSNHL
jgi:hypothetical protein